MFGHWFERELGQIVAPDGQIETETTDSTRAESRSSFWQTVAPDPNFASPNVSNHKGLSRKNTPQPPPASMFPPDPHNGTTPYKAVKCIHCLKMTPVQPQVSFETPSPSFNNNGKNNASVPTSSTLATPVSASTPLQQQQQQLKTPLSEAKLSEAVLGAARETAMSMMSPPTVAELRNKVFRLCASSKPLNDKLRARLRRLISQSADPSILLSSRSSRLGNLVIDGYTPLMAAASVNNITALEILLDFEPVQQWNERDLQGRTALHIAAEAGHVEAVEILRKVAPEDIGELAPIDLTGATPLGRAVLSKTAGARNNSEELHKSLFSPGDVSVYGDKAKKLTPLKRRTSAKLPMAAAAATPASVIGGEEMPNSGHIESLRMSYGLADMPGLRVAMEDAICFDFWTTTTTPQDQSQSQSECHALLGVCDGHGDGGMCSEFIAENTSSMLRSTDEYTKCNYVGAFEQAYPKLDIALKGQKLQGGTTAAIALLTPTQVIVANVGDSRCILIQSAAVAEGGDSATDSLEKSMATMTVNDKEEEQSSRPAENETTDTGAPSQTTESVQPTVGIKESKGHIVKELSEDHKPCLESEKGRIENAGLQVVSESFKDDHGQEVTISKVQLNDSERMAVARSFGDFEYKSNTSLSDAEQAVVVTPDIRVHTRTDNDLYLVLACDGIWDVMTSDQAGDFLVHRIEELKGEGDVQGTNIDILTRAGDMLLNECLNRGSRDNMTVVIAALSKEADEIGGRRLESGKALNFADE